MQLCRHVNGKHMYKKLQTLYYILQCNRESFSHIKKLISSYQNTVKPTTPDRGVVYFHKIQSQEKELCFTMNLHYRVENLLS